MKIGDYDRLAFSRFRVAYDKWILAKNIVGATGFTTISRNRVLDALEWLYTRDELVDDVFFTATTTLCKIGELESDYNFTTKRKRLVDALLKEFGLTIDYNRKDKVIILRNISDGKMHVLTIDEVYLRNVNINNGILRDMFFSDANGLYNDADGCIWRRSSDALVKTLEKPEYSGIKSHMVQF